MVRKPGHLWICHLSQHFSTLNIISLCHSYVGFLLLQVSVQNSLTLKVPYNTWASAQSPSPSPWTQLMNYHALAAVPLFDLWTSLRKASDFYSLSTLSMHTIGLQDSWRTWKSASTPSSARSPQPSENLGNRFGPSTASDPWRLLQPLHLWGPNCQVFLKPAFKCWAFATLTGLI